MKTSTERTEQFQSHLSKQIASLQDELATIRTTVDEHTTNSEGINRFTTSTATVFSNATNGTDLKLTDIDNALGDVNQEIHTIKRQQDGARKSSQGTTRSIRQLFKAIDVLQAQIDSHEAEEEKTLPANRSTASAPTSDTSEQQTLLAGDEVLELADMDVHQLHDDPSRPGRSARVSHDSGPKAVTENEATTPGPTDGHGHFDVTIVVKPSASRDHESGYKLIEPVNVVTDPADTRDPEQLWDAFLFHLKRQLNEAGLVEKDMVCMKYKLTTFDKGQIKTEAHEFEFNFAEGSGATNATAPSVAAASSEGVSEFGNADIVDPYGNDWDNRTYNERDAYFESFESEG